MQGKYLNPCTISLAPLLSYRGYDFTDVDIWQNSSCRFDLHVQLLYISYIQT